LNILKQFLIDQSVDKKFIAVRWTGGEPLLLWKKIHKTSLDVLRGCEQNGCNFLTSIVSNGYLLTEHMLEEMSSIHVSSIQITLDGPPHLHDKVRFLKDKTETFYRILQSIELASKYMKVFLRINIDKKNFPYMEDLFKILSQCNMNRGNVRLFCKPVFCPIVRTPLNSLFSNEEFYFVEKELLKLALKYELVYAFHWGIKSRNTRCLYHTTNSYLIDPELNLYRCPIHIGGDIANSVGYIHEQNGITITNRKDYLQSLQYSPFSMDECKNCKVLPICNGKCPILWECSGRKLEEGCIPDKFSLNDKLEYALENELQLEALFKAGINS
jgi:uncharacterized protein